MKKKVFGIVLATVLVLSLGLVLAAPVGADPGPGIAGLWHLDDNALDSSGNGNDGTLRMGTYLDFDGTDDYVQVPDSSSLDITSAITVEGWIKLESFSQQATVAGKWYDLNSVNNRGYLLTVDTAGKPRFYISTTGSDYPHAIGDTALSLNTWYHLAGTYDGTNIKLYVNGALIKTEAQTGSINQNDEPLLIGANDGWGGSSRKFTEGLIDEVRISDVVRTTFEACGVPTDDDDDTVALWHLDDGSGQTATDAKENNDGQLGSAAVSDANDPTWADSGPTWATGVCGDALSFDGDDCVCVPDNASLEPTNIAVEAWVNKNGSPGRTKYIVAKHFKSGYASYALYTRSGGDLYFYVGDGSYTLSPGAPAAQVWDGNWHHVMGTYDGSTVRLYVDCTEVGSGTSVSKTIGYDDGNLYIGSYGNGYYFSGLIDEVRIWDSATPSFTVDAEPETDMNPIGTDHNVDVKVEIDDTDEPAMCVGVNLDVISGPNIGDSDSDSTDCNGKATLSYTGDGDPGTDTIRIWVDQDCSGDFDTNEDAYEEITKTWFIPVSVDIKLTSCPNPLNLKSKGVLPVAILGTADFDVTEIDPTTVSLAFFGPGSDPFDPIIPPDKTSLEDVATPYDGELVDCLSCWEEGPDGFLDLTLKFDKQAIIATLSDVEDGDCVLLTLAGELWDGTVFIGSDIVRIIKKGNNGNGPKNK